MSLLLPVLATDKEVVRQISGKQGPNQGPAIGTPYEKHF